MSRRAGEPPTNRPVCPRPAGWHWPGLDRLRGGRTRRSAPATLWPCRLSLSLSAAGASAQAGLEELEVAEYRSLPCPWLQRRKRSQWGQGSLSLCHTEPRLGEVSSFHGRGTPPASQSSPNPQPTGPKLSLAPDTQLADRKPWGETQHPLARVLPSPSQHRGFNDPPHPQHHCAEEGLPSTHSRPFSQHRRSQCP